MGVRERGVGLSGSLVGLRPGGGSPLGPPPPPYEPAKQPTGQGGRIPGTLSFQEALALVRKEG